VCRGLETKLKHCLIGSDIFADQTPGVDSRMQFSASPNGKIREVSEAKKLALQVRDPQVEAQNTVEDCDAENLSCSTARSGRCWRPRSARCR